MELEKYIISIEKNGRMVPVGSIDGGDYRTAQFSYMDEYLDEANAVPVSISLPLQRERFSAGQTRQFFEGLLPEGFTRRSVAVNKYYFSRYTLAAGETMICRMVTEDK